MAFFLIIMQRVILRIHVDRPFFSFNIEQNENISPYLVLRGLYLTPITVPILPFDIHPGRTGQELLNWMSWWQDRIQCLKKYSSKNIVDVFIFLFQAF